jgi:hypothetical protein
LEVLDFAHKIGPYAHSDAVCDLWKRLYAEIASRIGGNPGSLQNIDLVHQQNERVSKCVLIAFDCFLQL